MLDPSPSDLAPPSPTGTEIVIEGVKKEFDQALLPLILEAEGIKVRDYGAEVIPSDPRDPEMWAYPIQALVRHDVHIRRDPSNKNPINLSGKTLWRLLDSGLVTQEEAVHNWTAEDWQAMNAYKTRPSGPSPYQVCNLVRPTASYREHMRLDFVPHLKDDKQEHEIFVPPDVPGMDEGDAVGRPHYAPKDWEENYDSKKRKVGEAGVASPVPSPHRRVVLPYGATPVSVPRSTTPTGSQVRSPSNSPTPRRRTTRPIERMGTFRR